MKNVLKIVKKLLIGVMICFGVFLMIGAFASHNKQAQPTQQTQEVKQVCPYNEIEQKWMGSYTASEPIRLTNGMKFSFSDVVEFNSKKVNIVDGKSIVYAMITKDESLCLYEIDVTGKQGWDKLQNKNNVYQVDSVERAEVLAYDLYKMGLPIDTEVNKMVHVTHIKGHLVHTHTNDCK